MKKFKYILGVFLLVLVVACGKDPEAPDNPYDDVDYGDSTSAEVPPDPNSIVGIHKNIFTVKCNNPGCHDGTFEPDFRTVQSTWSTLVYHGIVKNDAQNNFKYRVIPYNVDSSMLWRRLTVEDPQLQRMPATGNYLTAAEEDNIKNWINAGARDMFGEVGYLPNNEPQYIGYIVLDPNFARLDTNRVGNVLYNPFIAPANTNMTFAMLVEDDSTAIQNMQVNQLKFSYEMNDFSSATTVQANFVNFGALQGWVAYVNSASFIQDTTVYFRYYFNDGDHTNNSEFPRDDHNEFYKSFSAMYTQP